MSVLFSDAEPGSVEASVIDGMIDRYVDWRESALAVTAAHDRWCEAPTAEQTIRHAAYTATLDQEQAAAAAYEIATARLALLLQRVELWSGRDADWWTP